MKNIFTILLVSLSIGSAYAGVFLEPIDEAQKIYRGRAPRAAEIKKMMNKGITTVVIFKNETKNEVTEEIKQLTNAGMDPEKIHHIPFLWKDVVSEKLACEQIIDALIILKNVSESTEDKVLFHCTVGEDRTGLLAGLMSQLLAQDNTDSSFVNHMCTKGYAGSNTNKPKHVSQAVDKYLTPLFYKVSHLIEQGKLSTESLNKKVCRNIENIDIEESLKTCEQVDVSM